jgi:uncharacterized protein (TIGR02266 family)
VSPSDPPSGREGRTRRIELRRAGLVAAREAREVLAETLAELPATSPERQQVALSRVVGTLFKAEMGEDAPILEALEEATEGLEALRESDADAALEEAIGQSLALLHSARTGLAAAMREDTDPFLLDPAIARPMAPPEDGEERRRAPRLQVECEIGLHGGNLFFSGRTGDLSVRGIFVATDEPLAVGTELLLAFTLPDGYRVRGEGEVAWVRAPRYRPDDLPPGMGIRFLALARVDLRAIEHVLQQHPALRFVE